MKTRTRLQHERLEDRAVPATYSIDGVGNNLAHPSWGSAGSDLLRRAAAQYADGLSAPTAGRPSAREISNLISDAPADGTLNDRQLSAMIYAWGQFLDHDLDLTRNANPAQPFNVTVPSGDPYFDPNGTGTQVIRLNRSASNPSTGTTTPRQQTNSVTAWLDGSQIYGSDPTTAGKLRTHVGGRLKTSAGDMLPINNLATFPDGPLAMDNDAHIVPDDQLYAAGDARANENIELTSLHTLFLREHNRIADAIHAASPNLSDEQVYQRARQWVIAELQAITYNDWLPTVLGTGALPRYAGFKSNVNPGIANEFSTAGFRLGHSFLGDDVEFLDNNGLETEEEIPLSAAFFNPTVIAGTGIDPVLKYLASDPAQELDTQLVGSVRNFLFGPPGAGGLDLASLNIQRGRDHGLADYNSVRVAYGLPAVTSFAQITSDPQLQTDLQNLYSNVNNIDLWVGMLAENHVRGSSTGPLIRRILVDQFQRLRDGDPFWYQRTYSGGSLFTLDHTSLADVISRNTALSNMQQNVFTFRVSISGTIFNDANGNGQRNFGEGGLSGRTVELTDEEGSLVATTTTGSNGSFMFDIYDGLGPGRFQVRVVPEAGWTVTTTPPGVVAITRGDINARVNFGLRQSQGTLNFPGTGSTTGTTFTSAPTADVTLSQNDETLTNDIVNGL